MVSNNVLSSEYLFSHLLIMSICMGLLIGDNSLGENDTLISISIFMVPAILYLIPYMYGTIRFYEPNKQ